MLLHELLTEAAVSEGPKEYLDREKREIEKVAYGLFRNFTLQYSHTQPENDEYNIGPRTFTLKFNERVPVMVEFTIFSKHGFWGSQGTIEKASRIYVAPDAKNAGRAKWVDIPPTKSGLYAVAEFSGNNNKAIQVASAYLKQVASKISTSFKNSKFRHPDVERQFGDNPGSKVAKIVKDIE